MRVGMTEREALRWLADEVQAGVDPALSDDELRRCLALAAIPDVDGNPPDTWERWQGGEAYGVGDRVTPVARNGYVYRVTVAGQSGATEPAWPTTIGQTVADGGVTWACDDAAPWVPTYGGRGLYRAAARACRMKADKLAALETFSADGASFNPEHRRNYWLTRATEFARRAGSGQTIELRGRTAERDTECVSIGVVP